MTTTTAPEDVTMMNRVVAVAGGGMKKTVLITGVSKGLGRALALEMAKSGHAIIGCSRSQDKLDSLRSELQFSDDRHLLMNLDVVCLSLSCFITNYLEFLNLCLF